MRAGAGGRLAQRRALCHLGPRLFPKVVVSSRVSVPSPRPSASFTGYGLFGAQTICARSSPVHSE
eukprot:496497-Prymnesium_polylepis.1